VLFEQPGRGPRHLKIQGSELVDQHDTRSSGKEIAVCLSHAVGAQEEHTARLVLPGSPAASAAAP
jgi:hypothetical protein